MGTTKHARTAISRSRLSRKATALTAALLAVGAVVGGITAGVSTQSISSTTAEAGVLEDWFCVKASDDAGGWADGINKWQGLGGYSTTMGEVTRKDSLSAVRGVTPMKGSLTAYEKYGANYPVYEAWTPAWTDKDFVFKGVDGASAGLGADKLTAGSSAAPAIVVGSSAMLTTNLGGCLGIAQKVESTIANIVSYLPRIVLQGTTELYNSAVAMRITHPDSVLYGVGEKITTEITKPGGLRDSLFLPFVIPLILIGALIVAYNAIVKKRFLVGTQNMIWMVVAVALGTFFLNQPMKIAEVVDGGVVTVTAAIEEGLSVEADGADNLCDVAGSYQARRETSCLLWYASIYRPWVEGQFGVSVAATDEDSLKTLTTDTRGVLSGSTVSYGDRVTAPSTWAEYQLDRQATGRALEVSEVAYAQLSGVDIQPNLNWRGGIGSQIFSSIMMWFTVPASAFPVLIFAGATFLYQLMSVSLVFASPFFFLIGIIPQYGRRVLVRFAELMASLIVKRVLTALFLAIFGIFYGMVAGLDLNILLLTVLLGAVGITMVSFRGKAIKMLSAVDFGGNKSFGLPGGKIASTGAGMAGGLVGSGAGLLMGGPLGSAIGGLVGSMGASKATRAAGKDLEGDERFPRLEPAGLPTQTPKMPKKQPAQGAPSPQDTPPVDTSRAFPTKDAQHSTTEAVTPRVMPPVHQGLRGLLALR